MIYFINRVVHLSQEANGELHNCLFIVLVEIVFIIIEISSSRTHYIFLTLLKKTLYLLQEKILTLSEGIKNSLIHTYEKTIAIKKTVYLVIFKISYLFIFFKKSNHYFLLYWLSLTNFFFMDK